MKVAARQRRSSAAGRIQCGRQCRGCKTAKAVIDASPTRRRLATRDPTRGAAAQRRSPRIGCMHGSLHDKRWMAKSGDGNPVFLPICLHEVHVGMHVGLPVLSTNVLTRTEAEARAAMDKQLSTEYLGRYSHKLEAKSCRYLPRREVQQYAVISHACNLTCFPAADPGPVYPVRAAGDAVDPLAEGERARGRAAEGPAGGTKNTQVHT